MTLHYQYLPVIINQPLFGASLGAQIEGRVASVAQWLVADRIYQFPIRWRDWEAERALYDENAANLSGYPLIVTVKVTPPEYRLWPDFVGSPPRPEAYPALAAFVQQVIDRYRPVAVELYNEPDVRVRDAFAPECFGAWVGDDETWFAGGQRYGACCKYVKQHTSGTLILGGALMMHPLSWGFLNGALDAGLQADAISYHCYIRSMAEAGRIATLAAQIRQLTDLPLIVTETSLLGDGSPEHEAAKADYVRYLRDHFGYLGVEAVNWYAYNSDWNNADLIAHGAALPAWEVWRV